LLEQASDERTVVLLQSLGEFIHSVSKKRRAVLDEARQVASDIFESFTIVPSAPEDFTSALDAMRDHAIPFWDAMLWAAARRAGCSLLLTEDFQDGRTLDGVTFRNPFSMSTAELQDLLA
jgi:predicted nucleic acid-binding protein